MSPFQRLLVIVDPQLRHSPALQRAVALAEPAAARLHVVALVELPSLVALLPEEVRERTRDGYVAASRSRLEEQLEPLRRQGLQISGAALATEDRKAEILRQAAELEPDLLIKDVQHEGELKRTFITPLDWHLLRDCPVPLHLVGSGGKARPRMVVAAVDPSREKARDSGLNTRIIGAASALAMQCDAELHLLHAYDPLRYYLIDDFGPSVSWGEVAGELRDIAQGDFQRLADTWKVPASHRHFLIGPPTMTLVDFAREKQVDVLVMGRVQRKRLGKLVGSTTEQVVHQVPCGILAIAPEG